jgi:hypothetical protein
MHAHQTRQLGRVQTPEKCSNATTLPAFLSIVSQCLLRSYPVGEGHQDRHAQLLQHFGQQLQLEPKLSLSIAIGPIAVARVPGLGQICSIYPLDTQQQHLNKCQTLSRCRKVFNQKVCLSSVTGRVGGRQFICLLACIRLLVLIPTLQAVKRLARNLFGRLRTKMALLQ